MLPKAHVHLQHIEPDIFVQVNLRQGKLFSSFLLLYTFNKWKINQKSSMTNDIFGFETSKVFCCLGFFCVNLNIR